MTNIYLDETQEDQDLSDNEIDTDEAKEETISIEEFKKFQTDKEKGVQKLIQKQKAMDYAVDNLGKVSDNPEHLLVVAETNRASADYILKKYYGGKTLDEFKREILHEKEEAGVIDETTIRMKVEQEIEQRDINKFIKEFKNTISHHDEEVQEQIMTEYQDYIEGKKSLDVDKAKKYMYKAYQDIIGSKFDDTKNVASMMGVGSGKAQSKASTKDDAQKSFRDFMSQRAGRKFN